MHLTYNAYYTELKLTRRMTFTKRDSCEFPRQQTPVEIRAKCIEDILNTEKVYVQHLKDIVEVYIILLL